MRERRITVHLDDGTDRTMVVDSIIVDPDGIIHFARDRMVFLSAPREHVTSWDGVNRA